MKSFYFKWTAILVLTFGLNKESKVVATSTKINPETVDEIVNGTVTFSCIHSGEGIRIRWKANSGKSICSFELDQCPSSTVLNDERFECTCENAYSVVTNVSLQVSKITAKDHNTSWTCEVISLRRISNVSASLFVKVPVQSLNIDPSEEEMHIVENSNIQFNCSTSFSRPIPEVHWIVTNGGVGTRFFKGNDFIYYNEIGLASVFSTFDYRPNETVNGWQIYCNAIQNETDVEEIQSSKVLLDVNYPPKIDAIENKSVLEGSYFYFRCPVHDGNPNVTFGTWKRDRDNRNWTLPHLFLYNVTRYDDMDYNCTAFNIMSTSYDNSTVQGTISEYFHLNVEYQAVVKDFYVDGNFSNITFNEGDDVTFLCHVDSNPISNTTVMIKHRKEKYQAVGKYNISYTRGSVNCFDSGEYVCSATNKHNLRQISRKMLYLQVLCTPMLNPAIKAVLNVTTRRNIPVVFNSSWLAFPSPTIVIWKKNNGSVWTSLITSSKIIITNSKLNFSLTITNVLLSDIGLYKLTVENALGSQDQIFCLNIEDIPDPPSRFHVIADLITDSSLTVQWLPSFDGGLPQYFVLNYSKSGHEWSKIIVQSSGDAFHNFTLNGLTGGTLYQLILYSANSIGRSKLSDILYIQTKLSPLEDKELSVIGIAIGSAIGIGFSSIGFLVGVLFFRKRKKRNKRMGESVSYINMMDDGGIQRKQEMNVYDQINTYDRDNINKETCRIVSGDNNDLAIHYQKLGPLETDLNIYRKLSTLTEGLHDSEEEPSSSAKENAILELDGSAYVNLI